MTALIVLGAIAAVLTAIMSLKVGVRVSFGDGFRLWLVIGPVRKELKFDGTSKKPEKPAEPDKSPDEPQPEDKPDKPKSQKTSFLDGFDKKKLIKLGIRALKDMIKLPRIDMLEFNYVAGGAGADKTAKAYGKMCAAIGVLLPFMDKFMRVKKRHITTDLDFKRMKPRYSGTVQITVVIGAVVMFGLWLIIEFLKCRKPKETQGQTSTSAAE